MGFHGYAGDGQCFGNLFGGMSERIYMTRLGNTGQKPVRQIKMAAACRFNDGEQVEFITGHTATTRRAHREVA